MKNNEKLRPIATRQCKNCGTRHGIPNPSRNDNGEPRYHHIGHRNRFRPQGMKWKCQSCGAVNGVPKKITIQSKLGEIRDDLIIIYPGDGTAIMLTPSEYRGKPNNWRFVMDSETMRYHTTPELIDDMHVPDGIKPKWEKGEQLKSLMV